MLKVFNWIYGRLFRVLVDEIPEVTIRYIDDIQAARASAEALDNPYELFRAVPAKAVIFTDGKSSVLVLFCHHMVFDGGSGVLFGWEIFVR